MEKTINTLIQKVSANGKGEEIDPFDSDSKDSIEQQTITKRKLSEVLLSGKSKKVKS